MDHSPARPRAGATRVRRLPMLGLVVLLPALLACSAAPAVPSPSPSPPPDSPVASDPGVIGDPGSEPPIGGGPMIVEPEDGLVSLRPVTWDRVEVSADGRTLTVHWWGGTETCYGLADVQVERRDDGTIAIGLWEGTRPEAVGQACIEIAVAYATVVELEEPVIVPLIGGPEA